MATKKKTYEYRIERCGMDSEMLQRLTEMGNDGWELIAVSGNTMYFKRQK